MRYFSNRLEIRFVVPGKAVSFRSPNAAKYRAVVRRCARPWIDKAFEGRVEIHLDYFHTAKRKVDVDNVCKCVMDALNGLAYRDDRQACVQSSDAHDLSQPLWLDHKPIDIVKPLREYSEYLFVRVRECR